MKEAVTYQAILEEGEARGITKGEVKGALTEARKIVLRQGRVRFGPPDAGVVATLDRIKDVERLEELSERLLQVESWNELLGPSRQRRPRLRTGPKT